MDNKVKLAEVATTLLVDALKEFVQQGGRLRDGDQVLAPEQVAAPNGGLPALLYWAEEYYEDYQMPFASIEYQPDPQAYLGISVPQMYSDWKSVSFPLFVLSDFVVSEVLTLATRDLGNDLDLGPLFENFREWAARHYQIPPQAKPAVSPKHQPL
ncbi:MULTISPECIES: hypothetical protein [Cupriavidus]